MNRDKWHEIKRQADLSKDPFRFWPKIDGDSLKASGDHHRENLANVVGAARTLVSTFLDQKVALESDRRFTEEGQIDKLRQLHSEDIAPALRTLRETALGQSKEIAVERLAAASQSIPQPETPFQIAAAVESWRMVRESGAGFQEIQEMSPAVRQAVALGPPEVSGLNPTTHALIRNEFVNEFTAGAFLDSERFSEEVAEVEEILDRAQVALESALGLEPQNPMKVERPSSVAAADAAAGGTSGS